MEWKKVCTGEVGEMAEYMGYGREPMESPDGRWLYVPIERSLHGKHIRVTVEEAVDDCCEKWRRQYASILVDGKIKYGVYCGFCPECGSKL